MSNIAVVLLIILAAALFIAARQVHPGKNQQGTEFQGTGLNRHQVGLAQTDLLEVATFNVQTGKSEQGKRDIERSAVVLSDVHLAGVQEVYAAGWLRKLGFGKSQTEHLADRGGFNHLFAATRFRWFREQRGNAVLSKLPITSWQVLMLPDQSRKSPRNMTVIEFSWQGRNVVFINTHLHTGRGRSAQLERVLQEFSRHPIVILVGDFNTNSSDVQLAAFLTENPTADAINRAELSLGDSDRIDWILTKGFEVLGGRELPRGVSDHPFYAVSLKIVP